MIIALTGTDTFSSRRELARLRSAFSQKFDPTGLNATLLRGENLTPESFRSAISAVGFLAPRRLIVVEDARKASASVQEAIAATLESATVPEETILIFWDATEEPERGRRPRAAGVLARKLNALPLRAKVRGQNADYRQDFPKLVGREVERLVLALAKEKAVRLEPAAVIELAAATSGDLFSVDRALDVLRHLDVESIRAADVHEYVQAGVSSDIFALLDALSTRQAAPALTLLERHFASGEHPLALLSMLQREVRILSLVAALLPERPTPATIAKRLDVHPYVAQKALAHVRHFTVAELAAAADELVSIERDAKTSARDPKLALTLFVEQFTRRPSTTNSPHP